LDYADAEVMQGVVVRGEVGLVMVGWVVLGFWGWRVARGGVGYYVLTEPLDESLGVV